MNPKPMTLTQFLDKHGACPCGRERAEAFTSLEDAWQNCAPDDLRWAATRPGVLTEREMRLFAVFCARSVQHLLTDPRPVAAIDVAERYAHGQATDDELSATYAAANAATRAAYNAATRAAYNAAYATAYATAAIAAATYANAAAAAIAAATYANAAANAIAAANAANANAAAAWLRGNTTPNFN